MTAAPAPHQLPTTFQGRHTTIWLQVAEVVGDHRVMGAGCFVCSNKASPGVIHHVDKGDVVLGEYCARYAPYGISPRMRQVADDLTAAGINVQLEQDLFIARCGCWPPLVMYCAPGVKLQE